MPSPSPQVQVSEIHPQLMGLDDIMEGRIHVALERAFGSGIPPQLPQPNPRTLTQAVANWTHDIHVSFGRQRSQHVVEDFPRIIGDHYELGLNPKAEQSLELWIPRGRFTRAQACLLQALRYRPDERLSGQRLHDAMRLYFQYQQPKYIGGIFKQAGSARSVQKGTRVHILSDYCIRDGDPKKFADFLSSCADQSGVQNKNFEVTLLLHAPSSQKSHAIQRQLRQTYKNICNAKPRGLRLNIYLVKVADGASSGLIQKVLFDLSFARECIRGIKGRENEPVPLLIVHDPAATQGALPSDALNKFLSCYEGKKHPAYDLLVYPTPTEGKTEEEKGIVSIQDILLQECLRRLQESAESLPRGLCALSLDSAVMIGGYDPKPSSPHLQEVLFRQVKFLRLGNSTYPFAKIISAPQEEGSKYLSSSGFGGVITPLLGGEAIGAVLQNLSSQVHLPRLVQVVSDVIRDWKWPLMIHLEEKGVCRISAREQELPV